MPVTLSDDEERRRLDAWQRGISDAAAARELGLPENTYNSWRHARGLPSNPRTRVERAMREQSKRRLAEDRDRLIRDARAYQRAVSDIELILKRLKLELAQPDHDRAEAERRQRQYGDGAQSETAHSGA